ITGAAGTVSTALIDALEGADVRLRGLAYRESDAEALRERGAEAVVADLDDPRTLPPAFEGADDVFLLTPNGPRAPENSMNAVWAAREAGVERIVRLSAIDAAHDAPNRSGRLHALSDREIERSGLRWTILRPHWFMQNLLNVAGEVAATGGCSLDMAVARLAMIDARDIAACAARVLLDEPGEHHGETYTLSGPRLVGFVDVAAALGEAVGRDIAYRPVDHDTKRETLLSHGVPPWIADMVEEYARAYVTGWGGYTTGTVAALLGRPPRDIADFARDHAAAFAA
ncbi:MAG TPA: NAD(P)H-binding protein, partial [Phytomonospora sp.]